MKFYFCVIILVSFTINCFGKDKDYIKIDKSNKHEEVKKVNEHLGYLNTYGNANEKQSLQRQNNTRYGDFSNGFVNYDDDNEYVGNPGTVC